MRCYCLVRALEQQIGQYETEPQVRKSELEVAGLRLKNAENGWPSGRHIIACPDYRKSRWYG